MFWLFGQDKDDFIEIEHVECRCTFRIGKNKKVVKCEINQNHSTKNLQKEF